MPKVSEFPVLTDMPVGGYLTTSASTLLPIAFLTESAYVVEELFGTNGGTFTAGAWQKRLLTDGSGPASWFTFNLGTNDFTILLAGTYHFVGYAVAFGVNGHMMRVSGGGFQQGSPAYSNATNPSATLSVIDVTRSLPANTTLSVEHRCETTAATTGLGYNPLYAATFIPGKLVELVINRVAL